MPPEIQLESMNCRIQEVGPVEASKLYSAMGFLELDGLHTGLVRGSQLQFIIKVFPLDDKPEEIRTQGATQIHFRPSLSHSRGQTSS